MVYMNFDFSFLRLNFCTRVCVFIRFSTAGWLNEENYDTFWIPHHFFYAKIYSSYDFSCFQVAEPNMEPRSPPIRSSDDLTSSNSNMNANMENVDLLGARSSQDANSLQSHAALVARIFSTLQQNPNALTSSITNSIVSAARQPEPRGALQNKTKKKKRKKKSDRKLSDLAPVVNHNDSDIESGEMRRRARSSSEVENASQQHQNHSNESPQAQDAAQPQGNQPTPPNQAHIDWRVALLSVVRYLGPPSKTFFRGKKTSADSRCGHSVPVSFLRTLFPHPSIFLLQKYVPTSSLSNEGKKNAFLSATTKVSQPNPTQSKTEKKEETKINRKKKTKKSKTEKTKLKLSKKKKTHPK